jgi:hypothetical protein
METPQDTPEPDQPKRKIIFLILGLVFLAAIVAAYVFQDELYNIEYNDRYFLLTLLLAIPAALFCVILYNSPRVASELFGGDVVAPPARKKVSGGITYNVFSEQKPSAIAHHHHGWKAARRERRRLAREAKAKEKR